MSYDFSTPFVTASLVTKNGEEFPFWTDTQNIKFGTFPDSSGAESPLKSLAFLQEVSVELQLAYVPHITVTLAPPFRDAIAFLDSELIEWGQSKVKVQLGYVGGKGKLSDVFVGLMLKPDISIGEDVNIAVNAQGVGAWTLTKAQGTTNSNGLTRRAYIEVLAKGAGGKANVTVDFTQADNSVIAKAMLDSTLFAHAQGGKTFAQSLWDLCDQCHCTWRIEPDGTTVKILAYDGVAGAAPRRVLRLFDFPGGAAGAASPDDGESGLEEVYPILSLSSPTGAIYMPGSVRGIVMKDVSDTTRVAVTKTVNDAVVQAENTGKGAAEPADIPENPTLDETTTDGGEHVGGMDPEDTSDEGHVASLYRREGNMGIQLDVETLGIPDILPGETVLVEGVGRRLGSQRWKVMKVTHTIGLSGFSTSLNLLSNVEVYVTGGIDAVGKANTQEPEKVSGSTTKQTQTNQGGA